MMRYIYILIFVFVCRNLYITKRTIYTLIIKPAQLFENDKPMYQTYTRKSFHVRKKKLKLYAYIYNILVVKNVLEVQRWVYNVKPRFKHHVTKTINKHYIQKLCSHDVIVS